MASLAARWFVLWGYDVSKYDELDEAVLYSIGQEPKPFHEIYFSFTNQALKITEICKSFSQQEPVRVLDRRLQALRKKGLIIAVKGKGWIKSA